MINLYIEIIITVSKIKNDTKKKFLRILNIFLDKDFAQIYFDVKRCCYEKIIHIFFLNKQYIIYIVLLKI